MAIRLSIDIILRLARSPAVWLFVIGTVFLFCPSTVDLISTSFFSAVNANYRTLTDNFAVSPEQFGSSLPYIYVGILGIFATVAAIFITSGVSRYNQRKQDTMRMLLESRLSPHYSHLTETARTYFSSIDDGTAQTYETYIADVGGVGRKRKDARAVEEILNYFDFVSAGVLLRNYDEAMVKKTIRGILCNRVYRMRFIIQEVREVNVLAYENLVAVYRRWHNVDVDKILPDDVDLGPTPPKRLLRLHGWACTLPWYL